MRYEVWVEQINASIVEVDAESKSEAYEKAKRKWYREVAEATISDIQEIELVDGSA